MTASPGLWSKQTNRRSNSARPQVSMRANSKELQTRNNNAVISEDEEISFKNPAIGSKVGRNGRNHKT